MRQNLFLLLLFPVLSIAQSSQPSASVSGRWVVQADFYGTPINFSMELGQQGDKLTGNFSGDKLEDLSTAVPCTFWPGTSRAERKT